jgi:hypothetical protein
LLNYLRVAKTISVDLINFFLLLLVACSIERKRDMKIKRKRTPVVNEKNEKYNIYRIKQNKTKQKTNEREREQKKNIYIEQHAVC